MRIIKLETDSYYHVYNRGANKQSIFFDDKDYFRFLRNIWEANNKSTSDWRDYCLRKIKSEQEDKPSFGYPKLSLSSSPSLSWTETFTEYYRLLSKLPKLVKIICFSLLPNHYHLETFLIQRLKLAALSA